MSQYEKSVLYVRDVSHLVSAERSTAQHYQVNAGSPTALCEINAEVAHKYGRFDHERIFRLLKPLVGMMVIETSHPHAAKALMSSL